ncbi:MAG: hypothetical protein IIW48_06730 [Clostridia bacterium]|nr:hypothetical protein [Clostridia bacterium]
MNFKQKLSAAVLKLNRFMQGRYGIDEISYCLLAISFILMIISRFDKLWFFYFPALVPLVLSIIRALSKNITARISEREKFLKAAEPIKAFIKLQRNKIRDRKTHKYFKCKKCNSVLRVPIGKGKIAITCPKCGNKFNKKT